MRILVNQSNIIVFVFYGGTNASYYGIKPEFDEQIKQVLTGQDIVFVLKVYICVSLEKKKGSRIRMTDQKYELRMDLKYLYG